MMVVSWVSLHLFVIKTENEEGNVGQVAFLVDSGSASYCFLNQRSGFFGIDNNSIWLFFELELFGVPTYPVKFLFRKALRDLLMFRQGSGNINTEHANRRKDPYCS